MASAGETLQSPESDDEAYLQDAIAEFDNEDDVDGDDEHDDEGSDKRERVSLDDAYGIKEDETPDSPLQGERVLFAQAEPSSRPARPASAMPSKRGMRSDESAGASSRMMRPKSASTARAAALHVEETRTSRPPRGTHVASAPHLRPQTAGSRQGPRVPLPATSAHLTYEQLRKREDGWDADFVRGRPLEEPARGSGLRALRKLKMSRSSGSVLRPLTTDDAYGLADDRDLGTGPWPDLEPASTSKRKKKKKVKKAASTLVSKKKSTKRRPLSKQGTEVEVLCGDISSLWEQLHIPKRDREFFRKTYFPRKRPCNKPAPAILARLREQVHLLQEHRQATLGVLRVVQQRESALEAMLKLVVKQEQKTSGPGADSAANEQEEEAIHESMRALRTASIAVVSEIEKWRMHLWRPHPFNYLGSNYLSKMQTDARAYRERMDYKCRDTALFTDARACAHEASPAGVSMKKLLQVVKQEALLQCELRGEHKRLLSAGYYIPMLRWRPDEPAVVPERLPAQEGQQEDVSRPQNEAASQSGDARVEDTGAAAGAALESSKQHLHMLQQLRQQIETAAVSTT